MAQGAVFGILQSTTQKAFAIYSEDDYSLTFYSDTKVPEEGDTYKNKSVTEVYTGFENELYSSGSYVPWNENQSNVTSVVIHGSFVYVQPISTRFWFYNFSEAKFSGFENLDTSQVTDMRNMFYSCSGLTSLDVSNWDTSQVTNMYRMFYSCSGLTSLDVSNWDTSRVTDMGSIFIACSGLTSLDVGNWDTSRVTDMGYMFQGCLELTSLDVSNWDTSQVTNMRNMFYRCNSLTSLDVSNWDTSQVTNMDYMFYSCLEIATIYSDDSYFVTTKITSGNNMFDSCSKLIGGNGTVYDGSKVDYTMAHVDTASNPGYFTQK